MNPTAADWPIWTEPLQIRSYDVDFSRHATSSSLCRHFLEAAWNHAEALGVGFDRLAAEGKFWVLSRLRMELDHFDVGSDLARRREQRCRSLVIRTVTPICSLTSPLHHFAGRTLRSPMAG